MVLSLPEHLLKWLQNFNILKDVKNKTDSKGAVELQQQTSGKFFDGHYIALLLKRLVIDQQGIKKLQGIKDNTTPAIRLYNWNIITQILKKLNYKLDYTEKSKILNLDPQPLVRILTFLYNEFKQRVSLQETTRSMEKSSEIDNPEGEMKQKQPQIIVPLKKKQSKPLNVDIAEVSKKMLRDSENVLQLFVISISKHFKLSPKHTLNLFLDNNKYLAHLLVKGVKNSYEPIYNFLQDLRDCLDFIVVTLLVADEKQSLKFFLNALKPCAISKDNRTAQMHLEIMMQLRYYYHLNDMDQSLLKQWFKQQGINTMFFGLKRHNQFFEEIMNLAYNFVGDQIFNFMQPIEKAIMWSNDTEKLFFFKNFLATSPKQLIQKFETDRTCELWLKSCAKILKKTKENDEIYLVIGAFELAWLRIPRSFQSHQADLPNLYLGFLKSSSVSQSQLIFSESVKVMFSIMEELGNRKNQNAPFIYKILTNCLSFLSDQSRMCFLAKNFSEAFKSIGNLPGKPLMDPLIKSLEQGPTIQCLQLSRVILEENRISQSEVPAILDIYVKITLNDVHYGSMAMQYLFDLVKSVDEQLANQFLQKNTEIALDHFYSITKSITKSLPELISEVKKSQKKNKNLLTQQMGKHLILSNLIEFMKNAILFSSKTKKKVEPLIFRNFVKAKRQLNKKKQAQLLIPIMKLYYKMDPQVQAQIKHYQNQLYPPPPPPVVQQVPKVNSSRALKIGKSAVLFATVDQQQKVIKPMDISIIKPLTTAVKDLQKIQKKKEQVKTIEQKVKKQKDLIEQKKQLMRSVLNEKRLIEFGGKNKNMDYKCLYEFNSMKEEGNLLGMPVIKMINLVGEEEDTFVEDADSQMKKFRKVWRFMFFKYSTFGANQKQEFKQQKIHMSEIWKMLRQYDLMMLKKQESHALVRQVNQQMKRKSDLQYLTYLGFEQYLLQLCHVGYNKQGFDHVPPGQKIIMLITHLKNVTTEKGGNVEIFQNPQEVYFQETEVIKEFNKKLKQNPDYILPEGYKKFRLTELNYDYQVHPMLQTNINSSYVDVLQVLDQIFGQKLGFRIIQPITSKHQRCLAKPALFQKLNEKMKDYKQGYLAPKRVNNTSDSAKKELRVAIKPQYHPYPNFTLGIKLGVASIPITNRFIAEEVAYWVDDMLDAVVQGKNKVDNKAKKKVQNQFMRNRKYAINRMRKQKKQDDVKNKKRAQSVRVEAEVFREKKKQDQVKKRDQFRKHRKLQKEKDKLMIEQKQKQFLQAKKVLNEKKEVVKMKQMMEQQTRKKHMEDYKKGVEEYFTKKKAELEQKQEVIKKTKQEQQVKQKEERQKKEKMFKSIHLSNLKKEQNILQKVSEVKSVYEDVWTSTKIQSEFLDNQMSLKFLFDLLLKYEKSKISATSKNQIGLNTFNFFALKFNVSPFLVDKNVLSKIFKSIVKETKAESSTGIGISLQGFKQALFRVVVKSKQLLNGIVQKKKKKQIQASQLMARQSDGEVQEIQDVKSQKSQSASPKAKPQLTDEYLFNADNVKVETVRQLFILLNLPSDKQGVQQRYRQAIQFNKVKPTNILVKELKSTLQQI